MTLNENNVYKKRRRSFVILRTKMLQDMARAVLDRQKMADLCKMTKKQLRRDLRKCIEAKNRYECLYMLSKVITIDEDEQTEVLATMSSNLGHEMLQSSIKTKVKELRSD